MSSLLRTNQTDMLNTIYSLISELKIRNKPIIIKSKSKCLCINSYTQDSIIKHFLMNNAIDSMIINNNIVHTSQFTYNFHDGSLVIVHSNGRLRVISF